MDNLSSNSTLLEPPGTLIFKWSISNPTPKRPRNRLRGGSFKIYIIWSLLSQRRMPSFPIVKIKVAGQSVSCLPHLFIGMDINFLIFHASPQPLDEDIIMKTAPAIHRDPYALLFQSSRKIFTCELAPLIRIEYLRNRNFQSPFQGGDTKPSIQSDGQFPSQNVAAEPVHDRHQIHEPLNHPDVCQIGAPDLIRSGDRYIPQEIRIDLVIRMRPAGSLPWIDRHDPHKLHQSIDSLRIDAITLIPQPVRHAGNPVKRMLCVLLIQEFHQPKIQCALPPPGVIIRGAVQTDELTAVFHGYPFPSCDQSLPLLYRSC